MFNRKRIEELQTRLDALAASVGEQVSAARTAAIADTLEAWKPTRDLYDRLLAEKDDRIQNLESRLEQAEGKISLYETAVMPLSSVAGAQVAELLHPRKESLKHFSEPPLTDWQRFKRNQERRVQEAYEQEDKESHAVIVSIPPQNG